MENRFDYESLKLFYLGKEKVDNQNLPFVYKNKDLLTHAAIIGMTGSGKTGLGISLLEEASIDNIPSIIIDPKGDMGNLLLTFPNLAPEDFKPWIEEQDAINNGLSVDEQAVKLSKMWKEGLEKDFQNPQRVQKLKDSADFTIYTPGSSAGVQISILSSFKAPSKELLEDHETIVSLINSTVSSLLNLVDIKSDENSKEYILLSTIFMQSYSNSKDLNLEELISLIINPNFSKIGVFDIETFFNKDERMKFALKINSIIANPSFKSWIEGEPLDISKLLYDENGKAKVSIFSIAHLNDSQRMFFVSLLLNQFLTWMRRQEGTTSLKALLYMDEIFGYFPPSSNPPSKQPMLTLLKQARSFGVGIVLSTQNPVDIDYKGLANIGTWFIGRLQTIQDKEKVIDGLSSASQNINKDELLNLLSNIEKRNFIIKNINEENIKIFETRWALSYLKGPISKEQIKILMDNKKSQNSQNKAVINHQTTSNSSQNRPLISNVLKEKYLYKTQNSSYYLQPYLLCSGKVSYINSSKAIEQTVDLNYKIYLDENQKSVNFDEIEESKNSYFEEEMRENSSFYTLPSFIENEKSLKEIEKDFSDFIYRTNKLVLYKNDDFKLSSKQNESLDDFKIRVQDRINEKIDEEIEKIKLKFEKEKDSLEDKLLKLQVKLQKEQEQANATTADTLISIGTSLLGAFFGSSKASSLGKIASGVKASTKVLKERNDIKFVEEEMGLIEEELNLLQKNLSDEITKINEKYQISNFNIEEIFIKPKRSDIFDIKLELLWQEQ